MSSLYIYIKKNNSSQKDNADSSTMALCVYLHSIYLKDVVSTLSPSSSMNTYRAFTLDQHCHPDQKSCSVKPTPCSQMQWRVWGALSGKPKDERAAFIPDPVSTIFLEKMVWSELSVVQQKLNRQSLGWGRKSGESGFLLPVGWGELWWVLVGRECWAR